MALVAMNRGSCTPVRSFPTATNLGRADADAPKLKILVIATQKTVMAARISMALADVGFCVAALTPHGHPVRRSRKIQDHFAYHTGPQLKSTVRATAGQIPIACGTATTHFPRFRALALFGRRPSHKRSCANAA